MNAKIYAGKEQNGTHRNLGRDIVMELSAPYHHTVREIVRDNHFTSHDLATSLLAKGLTLLGTIRAHRREIPNELRNKKREVGSSVFAFDHRSI